MNKMQRKNRNLSVKLMALLFAMSALQVSAKNPYELSIYGGGGYSFCSYRLSSNTTFYPGFDGEQLLQGEYFPPSAGLYAVKGVSSNGGGGDLGVGFTGFMTPYIALHVGIGLGISNLNVKVDSLKTATFDLDDKNNPYKYDLYSILSDYREKRRTFSLSIPLMLQFQTIENPSGWGRRTNLSHGFYLKAGFKLNILLSNAYEMSIKDITNSGYYPNMENWVGSQKFAGFGNFKFNNTKKENIGFFQAILALEAGMKWSISNDMFVYTGAYFDYGLNDPAKNNRQPTSDFTLEKFKELESNNKNTSQVDLQDFTLLDFAEKSHLMTIGLKVSLAFIRR